MQELILLRHAEALASTANDDDQARALSVHGQTEAEAAGRWLHGHGARPDRVLCSPAQRARETASMALAILGDPAADYDERIYEATPGDLITLLDDHSDARQVLLVGHNPGLERLVALLVEGRSQEYRGMPPAAIAWLHLDDSLEPGSARLHAFWSP